MPKIIIIWQISAEKRPKIFPHAARLIVSWGGNLVSLWVFQVSVVNIVNIVKMLNIVTCSQILKSHNILLWDFKIFGVVNILLIVNSDNICDRYQQLSQQG